MYCIYILASKKYGVLYVGMTSDLGKRMFEHKNCKSVKSFSNRYYVKKLVYYEATDDRDAALYREKQLKKWKRRWKEELIEGMNPEWRDLSEDMEW